MKKPGIQTEFWPPMARPSAPDKERPHPPVYAIKIEEAKAIMRGQLEFNNPVHMQAKLMIEELGAARAWLQSRVMNDIVKLPASNSHFYLTFNSDVIEEALRSVATWREVQANEFQSARHQIFKRGHDWYLERRTPPYQRSRHKTLADAIQAAKEDASCA